MISGVCTVVKKLKFACPMYSCALVLVGFCVLPASELSRMLDLKGKKHPKTNPKDLGAQSHQLVHRL